MDILLLVVVGSLVGVTTVLFGFGGGFVTVPIVSVVDARLGGDAVRAATATSALVMLVNAVVATASTKRDTLRLLRGRTWLLVLLAVGGSLGAFVGRLAPDAVLRWGFVLYVGATAIDLVARPGFLYQGRGVDCTRVRTPGGLRSRLGLPIGAVAAFLGVGGSVMTVPLMRRAGATMQAATALANPLTLAIVSPAVAVTLFFSGHVETVPGFVGAIDLRTALALLAGAMPVIVILRRRPPHIPERIHAACYIALLVASAAVVALQ